MAKLSPHIGQMQTYFIYNQYSLHLSIPNLRYLHTLIPDFRHISKVAAPHSFIYQSGFCTKLGDFSISL